MKIERVDELLRVQPPDEPAYRGELLLGPRLVRPARSTPRTNGAIRERRWWSRGRGRHRDHHVCRRRRPTERERGTDVAAWIERRRQVVALHRRRSWLDATPAPSPTPEPTTNPRSYPSCTTDDVVLEASGWGGATGSLSGGAALMNLAANPCTMVGRPSVDLVDGHGEVIARASTPPAIDPADPLVVLPSGGVARVVAASGPTGAARPRRYRFRSASPS